MSGHDIFKAHGVTRLCHFTKLQNFTHIIASADGILAASAIRPDTKNVTDKLRADHLLDHVCCSIEYPNSWFLEDAIRRDKNSVFREWVTLYINLEILNIRETKFCPCNASKRNGAYINGNMEQVAFIFTPSLSTFRYPMSSRMLKCCPTDGQAEILIKDNVPRKYIIGIAVGNKDAAERVYTMIEFCGVEQIPIYIAPDVLTTRWSSIIREGHLPTETLYVCSEEE